MTQDENLTRISDEVKKILNVSQIDPDMGLGEMGVDSLVIIEVILACESVHKCHIQPEALAIDQYTSIRDLNRMFSDAAEKETSAQVATP